MSNKIRLGGFEELQKELNRMESNVSRIENKALRKGAAVIHDEIKRRAPRSVSPRRGTHAADHLVVGNVTKNEYGGKEIKVGITPGDNSPSYYLKFHEWGTSKMPAKPFMEPAFHVKEQQARKVMEDIIRDAITKG